MEGKKRISATAAWCLVAVLLLSGQLLVQPVAGESEFCRCYKECYAECRKDSGPYPCNFGCLQHCFNNDQQPPPARPKSAADCDRICQSKSICGVMSTTATAAVAGDADDACLAGCRDSIGHPAPLKDAAT